MGRMQRWALVAVTVTVAAFVMGLLGGLTGNVPVEVVPSVDSTPSVHPS